MQIDYACSETWKEIALVIWKYIFDKHYCGIACHWVDLCTNFKLSFLS